MRELGVTPSSLTVAQHYRGLIDGLVIDSSDHAESDAVSLACPANADPDEDGGGQRTGSPVPRWSSARALAGEARKVAP